MVLRTPIVRLSAAGADGHLSLSVRDNGGGVPLDRLPHAFDLFMPVDPPLDRSQGGLGIRPTLVKLFRRPAREGPRG